MYASTDIKLINYTLLLIENLLRFRILNTYVCIYIYRYANKRFV